MKLVINKDRSVIPVGTWGTKNENDYEILDFEFPEELEEYNKRIVYYLGNTRVWDAIVDNKVYITNAVTQYEKVKAYVWLTKENTEREADTDFRTKLFEMKFYENDNADGIVPTEQQVDGFNTMLTQMNNAIDEIDDKINEADAKIQQIDEAITGVENLNIDVSDKVDGDVTVTLTKKDNTTKTVVLSDGTSLEFMWDGTSLGIKTEDDTEYTYVDLQGVQGPVGPKGDAFVIKKTYSSVAEMNADFNNMQVGDYVMIASTVELEDNAKLYTKGEQAWIFISDFSGAQGIKGETGATPNIQIGTVVSGSTPNVTRTGTNENPVLNFTLVPGEKGDKGDTGDTGATGNGIASIDKTSTVGYVDTYTITYTNGNTTTFTVTNGEVTQQMLDNTVAELQQEIDELSENMPWDETTQATEISVNDAAKYSRNKLELFGNTEQTSYEGKNLLPNNWSSGSVSAATGNIVSYDSRIYTTNKIKLNGNTTYCLKLYNKSNYNCRCAVDEYDENNNHLGRVGGSNGSVNGVFTTQQNTKYINITIIEATDTITYPIYQTYLLDGTLTIMLEQGSATDYEPYVGEQPAPNPDYPQDIHVVTGNNTVSVGSTNYPINLGSLELCKIGDYQDYLYKENGNWYKYGAVGNVVLDGSENWNLQSINSYGIANFQKSQNLDYIGNDFNLSFNNYFSPQKSLIADTQNVGYYLNKSKALFIRFDTNVASTVSNFKAWLSTHNTTVYYVLDTPTITQITDTTLINQLEAIYNHLALVKGTNHITITPSDLAPYMKLNYMQDLPSKLETLASRIEALEE